MKHLLVEDVKEFPWQWLFPAKELTYIVKTAEYRRSHLHDRHVQKAIKSAVNRVQLTKRAMPHTFCHSFASHLLQENYDIRIVQQLLGHSNVRTTMIYTHTVPSQTKKELKSFLAIKKIAPLLCLHNKAVNVIFLFYKRIKSNIEI